MGDTDEPTVKERRGSAAPTVDHGTSTPKIADLPGAGRSEHSTFDSLDDRFETRGELGRGGMGRVDDAFDHALGRQVAIKHVLSQSDLDLARFEREARITARLEHPGIVPVHDIGRGPDGTPYYVMRRVDGRPLSELIEGKPFEERLRLVPNILAACDAAAYAHARGIVHRDIKPTNILVGPFGETLLIDWGLAREMESRELADESAVPPSDAALTRAGTVAGTPGFMSPEQARGESVDARTDVFALGATLFYVLAGKLPWHGGSTEMIDHVGAGRPADWSALPQEVPADLRAIVEKAMATDIANRYADAGALAADLRRFTLGNLVAAYEYGWFARLVRFVRRHRAAVSIAAISVVVLAIVGTISIRRVIAERDEANAARTLAEARQKEARTAADRLLVAHARELVEVDPTEAIAVLRTLPADSSQWGQAWAVASAAFYKGIPFGFVTVEGSVITQVAADDAHALVASIYTGRIILIDLVGRHAREVAKVGRLDAVAWFDSTHIICVLESGGILLDIEHGTQRSLPEVAKAQLRTSRAGLAVFHVHGELLELADANGDVRPIDKDIDEYTPSWDLTSAVIARGRHRELWTKGKTIAMPDLPDSVIAKAVTYFIDDTHVAALQSSTVVIWDVRGDELVERGRWEQPPGILGLVEADGSVYTVDSNGFHRADRPDAETRFSLATYWQTRTGVVFGTQDGAILIRDKAGMFRLGRRHTSYSRFDQSSDGRFLLATTLGGEVLVWDLSQLRPEVVRLEGAEVPTSLSRQFLWTAASGAGFYKHTLPDGPSQLLLTGSPMTQFVQSEDGHMLAAWNPDSQALAAADDAGHDMTADKVTTFGVTNDAITYGHGAGEVWQWEPPGAPTKLATIEREVDVISVGATHVAAIVGDGDAYRIERATHAVEHQHVDARITRVRIDDRGTVWMVAGAKAYRWKPAGVIEALATPEPVDGVIVLPIGAVFQSPRSLLVYDTDKPRIIATVSKFGTPLDDDLVVTSDTHGTVSIVDVTNSTGFDLPLTLQFDYLVPITSPPDEVAYIYGSRDRNTRLLGLFRLSIPREPAALRQWLATITNAKPVAGSEAVAWPSR